MVYARFRADSVYMRARIAYNLIRQQDKLKTHVGVVMKKLAQTGVPWYQYSKRHFRSEYDFRCDGPCDTVDNVFPTRK